MSDGQGVFISFEGIDGSGKSTQARQLAERLRARGHAVVLTREPGGSPGAEEIRRLVLEGDPDRWSAETEILLFTAARRDHLQQVLLTFALILILAGFSTYLSGILLRFNALVAGGIVLWIGAAACIYLPWEIHVLVQAGAIVLGYLVPGYLMNAQVRKAHA